MTTFRRSDAPPSLEAANQSQIDDLVRRNHALEYTNVKLSEQVSTEVTRTGEAVREVQKQWHEAEKLWREECEDLLGCYRYVYLRTVAEVETERINALNEQKALRNEKLSRLQRDYKITLFHAKERELEERIVELENANDQIIVERRELGALLRKRLAELLVQLKLKDGEIHELTSARDEVEVDVYKLREDNAHLQASLDSASSKLERLNLQFEGAQTTRSELQSLNDDLKRKCHDLQRQLGKWQRLDDKGDAELDTLRKRKIELEVEVTELRDRMDKASGEGSKTLEKERRRVERMKETTLEWQEIAEKHQQEAKDTTKELVKLRKELEQLKAQQDRASVGPRTKPAKESAKARDLNAITDSEAELDADKTRKPARRKKGAASESEAEDVPVVKGTRKRQRMTPVIEEIESGEEIQPSPVAVKEGKRKGKAKAEPPAPSDDAPQQKQRKRRGASDDTAPVRAKQTNVRSRASDSSKVTASVTVDDQEEEEAPKKKKRKVNIFMGSQPTAFDFGPGFDNGLGIPSTLSPVKENEGPIPNRTVSGSVMSNVGGWVVNRMTGRS